MSGLSYSFVYAAKPRAVSAMKYRHNLPPINGRTFAPGDTIQLSIPCGNKGEFLNTKQSYLKFSLKNTEATTTDTLNLDYSASAVIRLLEVVYGSTVLEYIDQYPALYHMLLDAHGDIQQMGYAGGVTEGMGSTARTGATINGWDSVTVCVPLISGVLGSMQHKYIPIGDMVRNHLRLNLTLASKEDPQVSAAARDWQVNDIELCCEIVKLDGSVANAISQANASGYRIPMTTFSNHASSVEAGSTLINTLISGNYRSLMTLFTISRLQENMGDGTKKTDLETQSHKSVVSESGADVSTSTIYLKAQFAAPLAKALRIDTFTHQDAILFIDPSGMAQTVF
eukprot:jgi/Tetstr1/450104/TSEL_037149.t1